MHMVGVVLSLICWMAGLVVLAFWTIRTDRRIFALNAAALVATIAGFSLYGVLPDTPALVQRICFAVFFGWYLAAGLLAAPSVQRAEGEAAA